MLVLSRKIGEEIVIGGTIRVTLVSVENNKARLGVSAPASVRVDRREVFEQRLQNGDAYHDAVVQDHPHHSPLFALRKQERPFQQ